MAPDKAQRLVPQRSSRLLPVLLALIGVLALGSLLLSVWQLGWLVQHPGLSLAGLIGLAGLVIANLRSHLVRHARAPEALAPCGNGLWRFWLKGHAQPVDSRLRRVEMLGPIIALRFDLPLGGAQGPDRLLLFRDQFDAEQWRRLQLNCRWWSSENSGKR